MSEEFTKDLVLTDLKLIPFNEVKANGTITKSEVVERGGYEFGDLNFQYLDENDSEVVVQGSIFLNAVGKPMANSAIKLLMQLRDLTGVQNFKELSGSYVRAHIKPQKKDATKPNFQEFTAPE